MSRHPLTHKAAMNWNRQRRQAVIETGHDGTARSRVYGASRTNRRFQFRGRWPGWPCRRRMSGLRRRNKRRGRKRRR